MSIVNVENLTKLYKNGRGIRNISFTVEKGETVGLLGPNGSGKTTTMKSIIGLVRPDFGKISLFGKELNENFEYIMSRTGALIEAPAIYPDMTAFKNMRMASGFYENITDERINSVLEAVNLLSYKNDKAGRFSLGMKQRLGLALALLHEPELVVLDEPTNGLDIEGIIEIREIINHLSEKYGTTFLIASHISTEIEKTCSKVAIMHEGELIDFTTTEEALRLNPTLEDYYLRTISETRKGVNL